MLGVLRVAALCAAQQQPAAAMSTADLTSMSAGRASEGARVQVGLCCSRRAPCASSTQRSACASTRPSPPQPGEQSSSHVLGQSAVALGHSVCDGQHLVASGSSTYKCIETPSGRLGIWHPSCQRAASGSAATASSPASI